MAVKPLSKCNLAGRQILWQEGTKDEPGANLGSKTVPGSNSKVSDDIQLTCNGIFFLRVKLASGSLQVKAKLSAAAGNTSFSSGLALDTGSISDANEYFYGFVVSDYASAPYLTIERSGGAGVIAEADLYFVAGPSKGYHELAAGLNSVGSNVPKTILAT